MCRTKPLCKWWRWVEDGSLRNNGAELILTQPTGGKDLEEALTELSNIISEISKKQPTPPEITDRCSIHTHIDYRSSTLEQVLSFFIGFCVFESALFTVGGKDRYDSIYCPGLSSCQSQITEFNSIYVSDRIEPIHRHLSKWCKYTSVNLHALRTHGSIEVRSHKGTYDISDIVLWIRILDKLKAYTDTVTPEYIVHSAKNIGVNFATDVFGELSSHIVTDNYLNYFKNNLRNAMDCIY
jgi:hypothetical protein